MQFLEILKLGESMGLDYQTISEFFRKLHKEKTSAILFKVIVNIVYAIFQVEQAFYCAAI